MEFSLSLNATFNEDYFNRLSPTPCWKLKLISAYCVALFSTSFLINGAIMYAFYKTKELRTPVNMFVLVFTVLSLIASFSESPFVIVSNYRCRFEYIDFLFFGLG